MYTEIRRVSQDVPVSLSSGYAETDVMTWFRGAGLAGLIQKPYRPCQLVRIVREVCSA